MNYVFNITQNIVWRRYLEANNDLIKLKICIIWNLYAKERGLSIEKCEYKLLTERRCKLSMHVIEFYFIMYKFTFFCLIEKVI
jgi:hypothetical protein